MIHLVPLVLLCSKFGGTLKVNDVLYASESSLLSIVGKRDPGSMREFGLTYLRPGYTKIWVDKAGPGMKQAHFCLAKAEPLKQFATDLGLVVGHTKLTTLPVPNSPIPLFRNKSAVTGISGFSGGKKWNVTVMEYAVANKARLRALKSKISAAPVGEPRNLLIRSCYDWFTELDLSAA
jgi:hypothetical protein